MNVNIIIISLIALLGIFTHAAGQAFSNFRGSSQNAKFMLFLADVIGLVAIIVFVIWGFFKFSWWVPVLGLVIPFLLMAFIVALSEKIWMRLLSIIAVPIIIATLLYIYLK